MKTWAALQRAARWVGEHIWAVTPAMVVLGIAYATLTGDLPVVHADPDPGCGYVAEEWWSPCNWNPPVPGQNGRVPIDGIPETFGPHGYTPITDGQ